MAERYGKLPSELLAKGTTQDIYVYDVALSYQEYVRRKAEKKYGIKNTNSDLPEWDSATLEEKFKKFKDKKE